MHGAPADNDIPGGYQTAHKAAQHAQRTGPARLVKRSIRIPGTSKGIPLLK
jgi:hypothetical protein